MKRVSIIAFVVVALVAGVLLLGGCSAGYSAKPEVHITAKGMTPASLTVKPGTTVTFFNDDNNLVAVSTDGVGSTPQIDRGKSATITYAEAGTYSYYDRYQPNINGTIVVK